MFSVAECRKEKKCLTAHWERSRQARMWVRLVVYTDLMAFIAGLMDKTRINRIGIVAPSPMTRNVIVFPGKRTTTAIEMHRLVMALPIIAESIVEFIFYPPQEFEWVNQKLTVLRFFLCDSYASFLME